MSLVFQTLCTAVVCYMSMTMGIVFAWPSCTLKVFESPSTPLHRPMTATELALFGSLSSIGALISTPIAGYLSTGRGGEKVLFGFCSAVLCAWGLIASSTQVEVILAAVFIAGLGAAATLIVRVFVSEICNEANRGAMTNGAMVFYSFGLLLSYLLGESLEYHHMVYVCLCMSVVGVILIGTLRESPTYLMKKGLEDEAAKSVAFYRRTSPDSKEVLQEMNALRRTFNLNSIEVTNMTMTTKAEEEKLQTKEKDIKEEMSFWKFIKKSRSTRKASALTLILITAGTFQGLVVVQVYAKPLFEEAVPTMSPMVCSVLQALVTVAAGLVSGYLSDLAGRRPLLIHASVVSGLCCVVLGSQLQFHWAPHWVTAVFLYIFTVSYSLGAGTVPYMLVTDVFLPEVKSVMSMLVIQWAWLCSFIILFIFHPLVSIIGLGPVFYLFAGVSIFTAVYSIFCLPETKGLPVDAVQLVLDKRRAK